LVFNLSGRVNPVPMADIPLHTRRMFDRDPAVAVAFVP